MHKKGIITLHRAEMLAQLMKNKIGIAITGAHGKTTTTAIIGHILLTTHYDPDIIVGGNVPSIGGNVHIGSGAFFVAEADESDRSLLYLPATIKILTNIDFEHPETYKDLEDMITTLKMFLQDLPTDGIAVVCNDDVEIQKLLPNLHKKYLSYGLTSEADAYATEIQLYDSWTTFSLKYPSKNIQKKMTLPLAGTHNVLNFLAAITACVHIGISIESIDRAIATFAGIDRRFSIRGTSSCGALIVDDYAHHPTEIAATITVARKKCKDN
jgi:UDP-N-acetylmuramate--alanine ligase